MPDLTPYTFEVLCAYAIALVLLVADYRPEPVASPRLTAQDRHPAPCSKIQNHKKESRKKIRLIQAVNHNPYHRFFANTDDNRCAESCVSSPVQSHHHPSVRPCHL